MLLTILLLLALAIIILALLLALRPREDHYGKLEKMLESGRVEEAEELIENLRKTNPDDPVLLSFSGDLAMQKEDFNKAVDEYEKALKSPVYSTRFDAHETNRKLGNLYWNFGRMEDALETFLYLLRLDPDAQGIPLKISELATATGNLEIAIPYLEKVLSLENAEPHKLAYAVSLFETGKQNEAISLMEELMALQPDNMNYKLYFTAMCQTNHFDEGRKMLPSLLNYFSDDSMSLLLLRMGLFFHSKLGLWDALSIFLDKGIQDKSASPNIVRELRYYLLLIYLRLEKFQEASRVFEILKKDEPNYRDLAKLKIFIDEIDLEPMIKPQKSFVQIFTEGFANLFPQRLVYALSGLQKDYSVSFEKFFNKTDSGWEVKAEYAPPNIARSSAAFLGYSLDELAAFGGRSISYLGYDAVSKHEVKEAGTVEIQAEKKDASKLKALFSLRQMKNEPTLSDIFISNFIHELTERKMDMGYILTNASLSEQAEKTVIDSKMLNVITGQKLMELVVDFENSKHFQRK